MANFKPVNIWLNNPQKRSRIVMAKEEYDVWGRGTGKTQGPIAHRSSHCADVLRRGATGVIGSTYMQLIDRTLPPLIKSWQRFGYIEDVHFWVKKFPPAKLKIDKPIYPVLSPEHAIFWYTGHVFHLISQDRPGLANGKTLDALIGDEARFLNHTRYMDDIVPINRGNREIFGHLPEHHMVTLCTDMPTNPKASWILDKKEQMDNELIGQIVNIQYHLSKLESSFKSAVSKKSKKYYYRQMFECQKVLNALRSDAVYYSEASSLDNIEILGEEQIRQWRREMTWPVFQAAILNQKVLTVDNGFYHLLDVDHHCYTDFNYGYVDSLGIDIPAGALKDCRKDGDLIKGKPLDIAMDYNSKIKSLVIGQDSKNFYKIIKAMYALRSDAKVLDDLIDDFCAYYRYHDTHTVNFYFDNTAKVTDATRLYSLADAVIARFRDNKWYVNAIDIGQQPRHETRYRMWEAVLKERDERFMRVRFNKEACDALLTSMQQTRTRQGKNGFEKDKRTELNSSVKPQDAPHLGDAVDTLYIGKYQHDYGYAMPVTELLVS